MLCLILQSSIHSPFLFGVLMTKPHVKTYPFVSLWVIAPSPLYKVCFICNILISGWKSSSAELNWILPSWRLQLEEMTEELNELLSVLLQHGPSTSLVPGAFLVLQVRLPSLPRLGLTSCPFVCPCHCDFKVYASLPPPYPRNNPVSQNSLASFSF